MPTNARCFFPFVWPILLLCLEAATSCRSRHRGVHYSPMQVAGTSKITLVVDSLPFDPRTAPNPFYLELMTAKDTFLVRPTAEELSFPTLTDSLTQVNLYYQEWSGEIGGIILRHEYRGLYFPDQAATIIVDTYPFEQPKAKRWLKQRKDAVYLEIRLPKDGQFFATTLMQDKWRTKWRIK